MRCYQVTVLPRLVVFLALVLMLILLAGCGVSPDGTLAGSAPTVAHTTVTALPAPTSLTVLRYSIFVEQNRVAPFQRTTQDAAKVQQLYHALETLPYLSPGGGCPMDRGIGYELSFMHGSTLVLQVVLESCLGVRLSNSPDCRQWTPVLTAQIAAALGVPTTALKPPNELVNTAGPNGPFAQPAPTRPVLVPTHCF